MPTGMELLHRGRGKGSAPASVWAWGIVLTALLCVLFSWVEPSGVFWLIGSMLLIGWGLWAWSYSLPAFATLLFVWITFYTRANLPLFAVEGGSNRGGVGLGDLLWLVFMGVWLSKQVIRGGLFGFRISNNPLILCLTPYLILSVLLPFAGVLVWDYPPSYATPGVRHLQWASFALLSYWLCWRYSSARMMRMLLLTFATASVVHAGYALIQLLTSQGVLPSAWLMLDQVFAQRFSTTWFFYPRTTGLLVNPNSYGLFGSIVLIWLCALLLAGVRAGGGLKAVLGLTGLWAIVTSASRSAIVGLMASMLAIGITFLLKTVALRDERNLARLTGFLLKTLLIGGVALALAWILLPPLLIQRVTLLAGIAVEGSEVDPNAMGRFELWEGALRAYEEQAPWGTWVPAGYAFNTPIDSYYISLLTQGTPLYLCAFLALLLGVLWHGWRIWATSRETRQIGQGQPSVPAVQGWVGLATIGIGAMIATASLTLSPLLETQTLISFWVLIGVGLALKRP